MPAPIAAAAATSAAGGAAAGGTAAAGTAAVGGTAATGGAAAGTSGVAAGTAARAGTGAARATAGRAAQGGKNIASRAKSVYNKIPDGAKSNLKKYVKNYASNKIEEKQQEVYEEEELKGINPVREEEEEQQEQEEKKVKKRGCLIAGCGGCATVGCLSTFAIPVLVFCIVALIPYAIASWFSEYFDTEKAANSTLAACQGCTTEELRSIKEKQWHDKIEALESKYGSKIDRAALIATVTYTSELSDIIEVEYQENYDQDDWLGQLSSGFIENFWQYTNGEAGNDFGQYSSVNISLLQYVADGMANSGDTYSDENYKKWLTANYKNDIFRPLYCTGNTIGHSVTSFFQRFSDNAGMSKDAFDNAINQGRIPFEYFTPKPISDVIFSSTVGSMGFYWRDRNNVYRICEYGFIEGMIPDVYKIQDDDIKEKRKNEIADDIIKLAEYYREAEEKEGSTNSKNTQGAVCYYKVSGIDEEISDIQVRTILSESGNPPGKDKYEDIPGEGLVDFETYILGVVNPEVGGSSAETWKTQAVVARSFALTRGQHMGGRIGQIGIEGGQWVLRIRTSTSDQVFCHPDLGCGSMTGSMQGTTSGAATVYAGGYNGKLTRQPIPEDASIRTEVASTKGQVATKNGFVQYTNFASKEQNSWESQAKAGKKYQDIVKDSYGYEVTSDCRGEIGEYDLEEYYKATQNASMPITCISGGKSMVDCTLKSKGKNFKSISQFNEHIKQAINSAGYGTRAAVVAASIALIGDYSMDTGVRLKYTWGGGHSNEHLTKEPVKDPFGLDCSGFIGWAIYHAGFKFATGTTGTYISNLPHGKMGAIKGGQPGDFLVNSHHTVMIIGTYDDGYYVAEAAQTSEGMLIKKRKYSSIGDYYLFDMENYYNNPKNKR